MLNHLFLSASVEGKSQLLSAFLRISLREGLDPAVKRRIEAVFEKCALSLAILVFFPYMLSCPSIDGSWASMHCRQEARQGRIWKTSPAATPNACRLPQQLAGPYTNSKKIQHP